jgi:hypothetical protein
LKISTSPSQLSRTLFNAVFSFMALRRVEVKGIDKIVVGLYPRVDRHTILVFSKVRIDTGDGSQGTGFGVRLVTI